MKRVTTFNVFWKGGIAEIDWSYDKIPLSGLETQSVLNVIKNHPDIVHMDNDENHSSRSIVFHWDLYEATSQNIEEIGKYASYYFGTSYKEAALTIAGEHKVREGVEWCCTIYANSNDAFLSGLSANMKLAREKGIDTIFCIHQMEFSRLYETIDWLKERNHELKLVLHEMYL